MGEGKLELIEPSECLRDAFFAMLDDYRSAGEELFEEFRARAENDFAGLVEQWRHAARGSRADEECPERAYWLVRDGRDLVGTARLRLELCEHDHRTPGHIGFDVPPSERRKGYATFLLGAVLEEARSLGMERVTLFCCKDNPPSARVIQKNRGRLGREFLAQRCGKTCQQYWIDL
jgi:predicted acetyltransferase